MSLLLCAVGSLLQSLTTQDIQLFAFQLDKNVFSSREAGPLSKRQIVHPTEGSSFLAAPSARTPPASFVATAASSAIFAASNFPVVELSLSPRYSLPAAFTNAKGRVLADAAIVLECGCCSFSCLVRSKGLAEDRRLKRRVVLRCWCCRQGSQGGDSDSGRVCPSFLVDVEESVGSRVAAYLAVRNGAFLERALKKKNLRPLSG